MEKVGFFGGCFNPPTNVHIKLAEELINAGILDKVIFVPVGDYYQKQDLIPAIHRYNMLKIACKHFEHLDVEDIASLHQDKLFATDTFELIYKKYHKEAEVYFIMGSDNFEKMPTWKNYEEIKDKYEYLVLDRTQDISSTEIRNKLQRREDVSNYISPGVLKYIEENKLYKIN